MNFCREIKNTAEISQFFLGRFQVLPQHCPAALNLGFKFIVRYVYYHPKFPFSVNQAAMPFKDEASATQFQQQKIEIAFENIAKFSEEDRQHYIKHVVREDGGNNWNTQPTYDALLIRYLPQLLAKEETQTQTQEEAKQEPLPTPTASTAELDQLSRKIQKETTLILDKIFNQVLERELKNVYEIEAKMNGESAQIFTQNLEDNLEKLSEIEDNMKRESAHIWVSIEAKVKRAQILDRISNKILEQKLKEVYEIEAKLQTEAWTVITQMDTIMLRTWLNKASKFQAGMY